MRTALGILASGAIVLTTACGGLDDGPVPIAAGADVVALGQAVYAANCATCHGAQGEGQPNWQSRRADGTWPAPPHDASGHTWHHPDDALIEIITVGGQAAYGGPGIVSGMPAFGERLSADEIVAALAYIRSLWGDDERAYQEALP